MIARSFFEQSMHISGEWPPNHSLVVWIPWITFWQEHFGFLPLNLLVRGKTIVTLDLTKRIFFGELRAFDRSKAKRKQTWFIKNIYRCHFEKKKRTTLSQRIFTSIKGQIAIRNELFILKRSRKKLVML